MGPLLPPWPIGAGRRSYTFHTFLVVGVASLAFVPLLQLVDPSAIRIEATWGGLGLALFMGAITTALSYVLRHTVLRRITASQGGVVQLSVPVLASAMGVLLLGEQLTATLLAGGALVVAGIHLNRVAPTRFGGRDGFDA